MNSIDKALYEASEDLFEAEAKKYTTLMAEVVHEIVRQESSGGFVPNDDREQLLQEAARRLMQIHDRDLIHVGKPNPNWSRW